MACVLKQAAVQLAGFQAVALRMLRRARQLIRPPYRSICHPVPVLQAAHNGLLQSSQLVQLLILVRDRLGPLRLHTQARHFSLPASSNPSLIAPFTANNADKMHA